MRIQSVLEGSHSTISSGSASDKQQRGSPLTPELLQLLQQMEPDAARRAQLITEHVTGARNLPTTAEALTEYLSMDMEIDKNTKEAESLRAAIRLKEKQQKKAAAAAQSAAESAKRNSIITDRQASAARDEALRQGASAEEAAAAYTAKADEVQKVLEDASRP